MTRRKECEPSLALRRFRLDAAHLSPPAPANLAPTPMPRRTDPWDANELTDLSGHDTDGDQLFD